MIIRKTLHTLTDFIRSKKGMWVTVGVWLALTIILAALAPSARDYEVSRLDPFPDDTQSVVAEQKMDHYFSDNDGIPAILVFQAKEGKLPTTDVSEARSEEHTSELQSRFDLVWRLLLEKKMKQE